MRHEKACFVSMAAAVVIMSVFWIGASSSYSQERVNDEQIEALFGRAHNVMRDQRARLRDVLDGFLLGDLEIVQEMAEQLAKDIARVNDEIPLELDNEAVQLISVGEIAKEAKKLEAAAAAGQYRVAYEHYANLVARCIACHQQRRSWGTFPEIQEPGTKLDQSE